MDRRPSLLPPPEADRYDGLSDLARDRHENDMRLKSSFEHIFAKYSRDFTDVGDEIDIRTGEIIVDNGHLARLCDERDTGEAGAANWTTGDGGVPDKYEEEDELASSERGYNVEHDLDEPLTASATHQRDISAPHQPSRSLHQLPPPPMGLANDPAFFQALGQSIAQGIAQYMAKYRENETPADPIWNAPPLPTRPSPAHRHAPRANRRRESVVQDHHPSGRSIWEGERGPGRPRLHPRPLLPLAASEVTGLRIPSAGDTFLERTSPARDFANADELGMGNNAEIGPQLPVNPTHSDMQVPPTRQGTAAVSPAYSANTARVLPKQRRHYKMDPPWTEQDDELLVELKEGQGLLFAQIAGYFPGRLTSTIKSRYYNRWAKRPGKDKETKRLSEHVRKSLEVGPAVAKNGQRSIQTSPSNTANGASMPLEHLLPIKALSPVEAGPEQTTNATERNPGHQAGRIPATKYQQHRWAHAKVSAPILEVRIPSRTQHQQEETLLVPESEIGAAHGETSDAAVVSPAVMPTETRLDQDQPDRVILYSKDAEKPWQCAKCLKRWALKAHAERHSQCECADDTPRPWSCKNCGKRLSQRDGIHHHIAEPSCCNPKQSNASRASVEGASLLKVTELSAPIFRTDNPDKPYSCSACGKKWRDSSGARYHVRDPARCTRNGRSNAREHNLHPSAGLDSDGPVRQVKRELDEGQSAQSPKRARLANVPLAPQHLKGVATAAHTPPRSDRDHYERLSNSVNAQSPHPAGGFLEQSKETGPVPQQDRSASDSVIPSPSNARKRFSKRLTVSYGAMLPQQPGNENEPPETASSKSMLDNSKVLATVQEHINPPYELLGLQGPTESSKQVRQPQGQVDKDKSSVASAKDQNPGSKKYRKLGTVAGQSMAHTQVADTPQRPKRVAKQAATKQNKDKTASPHVSSPASTSTPSGKTPRRHKSSSEPSPGQQTKGKSTPAKAAPPARTPACKTPQASSKPLGVQRLLSKSKAPLTPQATGSGSSAKSPSVARVVQSEPKRRFSFVDLLPDDSEDELAF